MATILGPTDCLPLTAETECRRGWTVLDFLRPDQFIEAEDAFRSALRLDPECVSAWHGLGAALGAQERYREGLEALDIALRLAPPANEWDGSPLEGRTLLVGEGVTTFVAGEYLIDRGVGDLTQTIRHLAALAGEGRVVLSCRPRMCALLADAVGIDACVSKLDPSPPFDVQTDLWTIEKFVRDRPQPPSPYLLAQPERVDRWQLELSSRSGFRIAIHWHGNKLTNEFVIDRKVRTMCSGRALPLECFAPLAALRGVQLVSVQQGDGAEELNSVSFDALNLGPRLDADGAFLDTAAVLSCVDLFITSDTGPVHVAGALGVPTWLLLGHRHAERWDVQPPLYPSVRRFCLGKGEEWRVLMQRVSEELRRQLQ